MIPVDEARARVLARVGPLAPRPRPLPAARGGVLAEDVVAGVDVFPFDNSAMDGYAVRSADLGSLPVTLPVVAVAAAGRPAPVPIAPGQAARILTGAVVPDGADCVVRVEDTDGGADRVEIRAGGGVGANIRRAGEAARRGEVVLAAGTVLNAGHLGVAASVGRDELAVHPAPRVAVVSTGDELVAPGRGPLGPGEIYDSNRAVLTGLVEAAGCPVTSHAAVDDVVDLRARLEELAASHDVVLTTGGVSMGGEYDVVQHAVADHDVELWRVAMKPAKPMAFGRVGDALFFGLAGNPVSAVVAFEVFVRPAVRALRGVAPAVPPTVAGEAGGRIGRGDDGKAHFVRVARAADGRWHPTGAQGSQLLGGIAGAGALAVLPPDVLAVDAGDALTLIPLWA